MPSKKHKRSRKSSHKRRYYGYTMTDVYDWQDGELSDSPWDIYNGLSSKDKDRVRNSETFEKFYKKYKKLSLV